MFALLEPWKLSPVAVVGAAASLVASAAAVVHLVVSTATARKKI